MIRLTSISGYVTSDDRYLLLLIKSISDLTDDDKSRFRRRAINILPNTMHQIRIN